MMMVLADFLGSLATKLLYIPSPTTSRHCWGDYKWPSLCYCCHVIAVTSSLNTFVGSGLCLNMRVVMVVVVSLVMATDVPFTLCSTKQSGVIQS